MNYIGRVALAVIALVISPTITIGQAGVTGFPPFDSSLGGVDLQNLNAHRTIPILHKNGRGLPLVFDITHDDPIFGIIPSPGGTAPPQFSISPNAGWTVPFTIGGSVSSSSAVCSTDPSAYIYTNWTYTDAQGTVHEFIPIATVSTDPNCGSAQATASAIDHSGYSITANGNGSAVVTDMSGTSYTFTVGSYPTITDANGNVITAELPNNNLGSITDTVGISNEVTINGTLFSPGLQISSMTYTYQAPDNTTASVVVNYKLYPQLATGFGCQFVAEGIVTGAGLANLPPGVSLVDNIVLGDGSKYVFTYEPTPTSSPVWAQGSVTGRLASVTLPTGAIISYTYPGPNGGINCQTGGAANVTLTTTDNGSTSTWSYSGSTPSSPPVIVTDPLGNQTVVTFQWGLETKRQIYQGGTTTGSLLETILTCYNGNKPGGFCTSQGTRSNITEISAFVQFPGGLENERDTFFVPKSTLPAELDEYDFGSGQPGALLRKTVIAYAALTNNILDLPASVTVCSPGGSDTGCNGVGTTGGTKVRQTTFGYDETAVTPTSVTQHVAVSGSRGNPTSIHQWLNTSGGTLNTINTFDDTGNILSTTDPGGHTSFMTYGPACNGAFLTQTKFPDTNSPNLAHHITSTTYDCNTGLVATTTDQNNQVTKFFYDDMFRQTEVDYPDGGQTLTSYTDANHVTVQSKIDGSRSTTSTTLLDGEGRISRAELANGESTPYDQQDFCYDANGRLGFQSYPYQGSGFGIAQVCSGAGDGFSYDALGRPTQVMHSDGSAVAANYAGRAIQVTDEGNGSSNVSRIYQKDGLGHVANVCEVYSGSALLGNGGTPGNCGLDITGNGFLTSYSYDLQDNLTGVTQGTLNNRLYQYDSLSRMTSEATPEAGSVTYGYSPDSLLTSRVRSAPNQADPTKQITTTYNYDALHRLTNRTYATNDSVNAPVNTPAAHFQYDTDPVWANPPAPLTNLIGRLSLAYTDSENGSSIFGYDPMGRLAANNQCTPSNCASGNWPLDYTYDFLGDTTSATNGVGVTFNYTYNIAGRLTKMTSSMVDQNHPGTLFSGATYSPTVMTDVLGNGVVETTNYSSRGFLQSYLASAPTGAPGAGSVVISGSLQTYQQQTQAAEPGQASFTITSNGNLPNGDRSKTVRSCQLVGSREVCTTITYNDTGTMTVTVNGFTTAQVDYNGDTSISTLAQNLATALSVAGSPVTATASGGTVTMTAVAAGAGTNYSWSSSSLTNNSEFQGGTTSFPFSPASGTMSGGQNAIYQTVYDNGATTIEANGYSDTYSWSGSGTTSASIAQGLCNKINGDTGAPVTASTNGIAGQCPSGSTTVSLVSKQDGAVSDYSLSGTSSSSVVNSFSTSCPGFSSCSEADLTGGGASAYSYSLGTAPDGQVTSANDLVNGNWAFGYDPFNRLASSNKNAGQQTFTYANDRYSNRLQQNAPQGGPSAQQTFDNNNHIATGISGLAYDALGNVTNDGFHSYAYDDESRMISVDAGNTATYIYDALGRRVSGPNGQYLYDSNGMMITQITAGGVWAYGEIYAAARHILTYSAGTTNFLHADWLGTKRVMTSLTGAISQTCTGFAYGDGAKCTGTNWSFSGFTDDIFDPETNLDHTPNRQYSSSQGRWLTPDPAGISSADPTNPQSWNRYAYVQGDPTDQVDPLGLGSGDGLCFGLVPCSGSQYAMTTCGNVFCGSAPFVFNAQVDIPVTVWAEWPGATWNYMTLEVNDENGNLQQIPGLHVTTNGAWINIPAVLFPFLGSYPVTCGLMCGPDISPLQPIRINPLTVQNVQTKVSSCQRDAQNASITQAFQSLQVGAKKGMVMTGTAGFASSVISKSGAVGIGVMTATAIGQTTAQTFDFANIKSNAAAVRQAVFNACMSKP